MLEFGGLFQLNPTGFVLAVSADDIETFRALSQFKRSLIFTMDGKGVLLYSSWI